MAACWMQRRGWLGKIELELDCQVQAATMINGLRFVSKQDASGSYRRLVALIVRMKCH